MKSSYLAFAIVFSVCGVIPVAGQESRAEELARRQAEKAVAPPPYVPGKGEHLVKTLENVLYGTPSGFYPYLDGVYSGGGLTAGAGYRDFYGDSTFWDVKGLYSLKAYKMAEVSTTSLGLAGGKVALNARLGLRDTTQVGFYGVGDETGRDDRANYAFTQVWLGGDASFRPVSWAAIGAGLGYEDFDLGPGKGSHASIETVYDEQTAPGLGHDPAYLHATASAAIDTRPAPGYARKGSLAKLQYHNYNDRKGQASFDRLELDVVQHVPVLRENWVVSLHGNLTTTLDGDVPYFQMPSVGGGDSLRAYSSFRFRDRHSLLLQGEFRWIPNRYGLDMALFYDAGTVAPERSGLSLSRMHTDVGVGVRLHSLVATPVRIDVARGQEGLRLVFSGSAAF